MEFGGTLVSDKPRYNVMFYSVYVRALNDWSKEPKVVFPLTPHKRIGNWSGNLIGIRRKRPFFTSLPLKAPVEIEVMC